MACQPGRPPTVAQKDAAAGGEQPPGRNIVNSGNPRFFFLMKTLEPGLLKYAWKTQREYYIVLHVALSFSFNLDRFLLGAESQPLFVCCLNYIIDRQN
jgi:hypothetical protein